MHLLQGLCYDLYPVEKQAFSLQHRELEILNVSQDVSNLKIFMKT